MTHRSLTLLSCLRHRLTVVTWLFVVLMLAKAGFAATCFADGLTSLPSATVPASSAAPLDLATSGSLDDDSGNCWHADSNGCHCACVHSTALASMAWTLIAIPFVALRFFPSASTPLVAFYDDHLRPPIA